MRSLLLAHDDVVLAILLGDCLRARDLGDQRHVVGLVMHEQHQPDDQGRADAEGQHPLQPER